MLKHIKILLKDSRFILALIVTLSILTLSLMRMPHVPTKISFANIDKVYHAIAYFTLTISWLIAYYKKPSKKYLVVILCIIFGIIIEVLQSTITKYRTGDYYDLLANSTGVLLALLIFNLFSKKK